MAILVLDLIPLKLVAACLPLRLNCQFYDHTHCTVWWFPLVEACLDVCCELEEGRCNRVSGSEAVLIFCW